MGWDIHFTKTRKIGEILQDKDFNIRFRDRDAIIYTIDEDGDESGLLFPGITEENYKDSYTTYGYCRYGANLRPFLWKLYTKYDMWFVDTCLDDWYYLQGECKDEEEEQALWDYCFASEMTSMFGNDMPSDDKMWKILEQNEPIRDELYGRYNDTIIRKREEAAQEIMNGIKEADKTGTEGL